MIQISCEVSRVAVNVMSGYCCRRVFDQRVDGSGGAERVDVGFLVDDDRRAIGPSSWASLARGDGCRALRRLSSRGSHGLRRLLTTASRMSSTPRNFASLRTVRSIFPVSSAPAGILALKSAKAWRDLAKRESVLGHQVGVHVDVNLALLAAKQLGVGDAVDFEKSALPHLRRSA